MLWRELRSDGTDTESVGPRHGIPRPPVAVAVSIRLRTEDALSNSNQSLTRDVFAIQLTRLPTYQLDSRYTQTIAVSITETKA